MVFTLGSCFFIFLVSPHFWSEWWFYSKFQIKVFFM
jgi:hypothetical protein